MTLRDRVRDILDTLDGIDVDPKLLGAEARPHVDPDAVLLTLQLRTCSDYETACKAWKVKPSPGRLLARASMRAYETLAGDLLLTHHCFPHLDCWGQK